VTRVAVALLAVIGAACAGGGSGGSGAFKIGVLLPLTGSTAWGGQPARLAAELAAQEVGEARLAGDHQIELVFADGACDPRVAYAAADKLVQQDRVQLLIGEWCSSASIAAAQVANDAKVPMLVQISTADGIPAAGPYVFQTIMPNAEIQAREGKLLLERFTFRTAAILVENNDFGLSFRKNMRALLEQAGVTVVLDIPQDRQDANWYATITRIKDAAPELVVMSIAAAQAANFIKQYAESQLTVPIFSDYTPPPFIFERQVAREAGAIGLVRGAFFLSGGPRVTARQRAFTSRFEPAAAQAFKEQRPALLLAADALKRGGPEREGLVAALGASRFEGALGRYEFDANRVVKPEGFDFLFIRTTRDGGLEVVE
jgi:branched-chain amino acid transport system substrate-binding protein